MLPPPGVLATFGRAAPLCPRCRGLGLSPRLFKKGMVWDFLPEFPSWLLYPPGGAGPEEEARGTPAADPAQRAAQVCHQARGERLCWGGRGPTVRGLVVSLRWGGGQAFRLPAPTPAG